MLLCRRCCAELNVLLQWYSNQISQLPLAAHCSWPHAAKAATLEQVAKACQHSKLPNTWVQLQMVSHLMHTILHDHENLAISKSTIALHRGCPAWLQSWCSRWGFTEEYISILTLEAYAVQTSSTARDFCGRPLEPCAPQLTPVNLLYVPYIF